MDRLVDGTQRQCRCVFVYRYRLHSTVQRPRCRDHEEGRRWRVDRRRRLAEWAISSAVLCGRVVCVYQPQSLECAGTTVSQTIAACRCMPAMDGFVAYA